MTDVERVVLFLHFGNLKFNIDNLMKNADHQEVQEIRQLARQATNLRDALQTLRLDNTRLRSEIQSLNRTFTLH